MRTIFLFDIYNFVWLQKCIIEKWSHCNCVLDKRRECKARDCILLLFPQNNKMPGLIEFGPSLLQLSMHISSCQLQITHAARPRSKITLNRVKWDKIKRRFIVGAWIGVPAGKPRRKTYVRSICVHLQVRTAYWPYIKINYPCDFQWLGNNWDPTTEI